MTKQKKLGIIVACGAVMAAISLLVFFGCFPGEKLEIDWWILGFALFAEAVLFAGIGLVALSARFHKRKIVGAGFVCCLFLYWVLCVACSMLTRSIFTYHIMAFFIMQLILFAAIALVSTLLMIWVTRAEAADQDAESSEEHGDIQA